MKLPPLLSPAVARVLLVMPAVCAGEPGSEPRPPPPIVGAAIINEAAIYPECHASTVAELASGALVAAWFGGTKERNPDVGIWVSRQVADRWQRDVEVANGLQPDGRRFPTWNPVLFNSGRGPLVLFYKVGPSPSQWWGMMMTSTDGGATWGPPRRLPDGILGPIKNKPVLLRDGAWLCPSSTEGAGGWRVHFETSRDGGGTWVKSTAVADPLGLGGIQPAVLLHRDGRLQALMRTRTGSIGETWSEDQGRTWSPLARTGLPNPNSGIDAVTLADGRHLVVYNHSAPPPERPNKGLRYPLDVAVSRDGREWRHVVALETEPVGNGYAYPAVIQGADGRVHVTYTVNRQRIKHVVLDPTKL